MRRRYPRFKPYKSAPTAPATPVNESEKISQYDSWGAMIEHSINAPADLERRVSRETGAYRENFTRTATFEEAVNLAINGWQDGTDRAANIAYALVDKISSQLQREDYNYSTTGITFDVARVLENEPECWIEYQPVLTDAPGKVLRMVFNYAVSAAISADVIMAKGAVAAALVILLERAGFRVAVDICCVLSYNETHETWVPVKSPNQDLDLARLVFALAHPSMLRRIQFSHQETLSPAMRAAVNVPGGYGTPIDCKPEKRGDIYIGSSMYGDPQWDNTESASQWIINELQKQGVQIQQENN